MADRTFYPPHSYGFARVYLEFSLLGNGAAAPLPSTLDGCDPEVVQSITRTGAGVYVIQLGAREKYNKVISMHGSVQQAIPAGMHCGFSAVTNEGTSLGILFTLTTWVAAVATDVAAADRIFLGLALRNSAGGSFLK